MTLGAQQIESPSDRAVLFAAKLGRAPQGLTEPTLIPR